MCTDTPNLGDNSSSPVSVAASCTRQTCGEIVRELRGKGGKTESMKLGTEVVFGTLLEGGLGSRKERDPVSDIVQVFVFIDQLHPRLH